MAKSMPPFGAALPKKWPRRVRSAVIHTISLAQATLAAARGWAANSWDPQVRLRAENERLREEIGLLQEEIRIKDSRMLRVPAQRRPHYPPLERLSILELRASRGWSLAQTARRLLVTTATVASWMHRVDEDGPSAVVRTQQPVNRFPDFVRYMVRRFRVLCPTLGTAKMAHMLCRAGLHLSKGTIRRMLVHPEPPLNEPPEASKSDARTVTAKRPNHTWNSDLTTVPTSLGLWTSSLPFALPQRWPFCWWVAIAIDHYSRRVMGSAIYWQQPTSLAVRTFLGRVMRQAGAIPRYLITDQGKQFRDEAFRNWCRRRGVRQRFGAVGKYGSIALIERFMRTLKQECTRRLPLVPYVRESFHAELVLFATWYNQERPHAGLCVATPDEIYRGVVPACQQPRFEPRERWPRGSPGVVPRVEVRGKPGVRLELHVSYLGGRKHLPIVTLRVAA